MPFASTFFISFNANQQGGFVDAPINSATSLQVSSFAATATNASTGEILQGIETVMQGSGIVIHSTQAGTPVITISPHTAIRLSSVRTTPSAIPVRVQINLTTG